MVLSKYVAYLGNRNTGYIQTKQVFKINDRLSSLYLLGDKYISFKHSFEHTAVIFNQTIQTTINAPQMKCIKS